MNSHTPLLGGENNRNVNTNVSTFSRILKVSEILFFSSPVNYLLFFVPLGIIAGHLESHFSSTWLFALNFFAIIPLASVLAYATEELADQVGSTLGGLLNATLGNAVELIVSILALKEGQVRIIQASMMGSILSNLLLVTGCCFVLGGYNRVQQKFNQTAAQAMSSLLVIACASLLIPAAFRATLPDNTNSEDKFINQKILEISRSTSIILLFVYCFFLLFQLKTHRKIFEQQENEVQENINEDIDNEPKLSKWESLIVLTITTILVSICADYLVGSIDDLVATSGLSKTFIGLVIIPIVGNAAEHVTSCVVAMKDKMDLALSVSVGSSLQIALFVTPLMVLLGWFFDVPMSLNFSTFETVILFISVLLANYLILDGESNWLEGVMSLAMYMLISLAFFFYPDVNY